MRYKVKTKSLTDWAGLQSSKPLTVPGNNMATVLVCVYENGPQAKILR